jgi:DNA helicase-2/ATP-dependent DNA helicase PcrA
VPQTAPHLRSAEEILAALDPEQRAAACALRGPVVILAGAGTGKTRAITHRIAHGVLAGVYVPQQVLAVTFTTRAAGEMRARLRSLGAGGVQARTFHSAALRQLQYFWPRVVGGELPRIESTKAPIVASAASRLGVRPGQAEVRDLSAEIEWAKVSQLAPADYAAAAAKAGRTPPAGLDPKAMADVYAAYEDVKRQRGVIDMEDILLLAVGILADRAEVAEAVRGQYRYLVVDEYQDVSPLQQRLLSLWLGDREELCVVGDPSQTIYSFAGASAEYLLNFPRRYPNAEVVRLVRNYRSTPQVVHVANTILSGAAGRAAALGVQLEAQRPAGPAPSVTEHPDDVAEADAVAGAISALVASGVPASEIAVLFRTNGQSLAYEQALGGRGVPFLVRGAERFFDRPEVRQARLLLRGAARSGGSEPGEPRGLVDEVRGVLASAGLAEGAGPSGTAARDRAESLAALVRIAEDMAAADPSAGLAAFVAELEERAADAHVPVVEGVTLASLHAAKGLEWGSVFLVGLSDGMVPITYAETPEEIEEERRLLYVGVTRAQERLSLSWALARSPGGRGGRRPSRFLDGLLPDGPAAAARPATARAARARGGGPRCRVCGKPLADPVPRKLGRCADCPAELDAALFDRLKTWRLERSREQSLPAFCVFTDATLLAIAETVPSALGELAAIPGVGKAKLDKYGADVLAICAGDVESGGP